MSSGTNNTPVLFLAGGGSDRAIAACIRSLSSREISYYICLPEQPISTPWSLSKYRHQILENRYADPSIPSEFRQSIAAAVADFHKIILFPTSDRTIKPLLEDPDWLNRTGIKIPLPEKEIRQKVSNKSSFTKLVREYGLSTPPEIKPKPDQSDIPFVAKPNKNISDDGEQKRPYLILDEASFDQFFSVESPDEYFYQEYITGESVYYCTLYDRGEQICDFSQITLCQQPNGGSVIKAAPTHIDDSVKRKFSALMADLEWTGPIMVEFRLTNDTYYTIEANPRFWGPLQLAVDNGVDLPLALYHIATEQIEKYDNSLYQHNSESQGYIRYNGYLNGWWRKQIFGGQFEKVQSQPNISYHDVWLRWDTAPIFGFELIRAALYPITTTINSPERVKSFVSDRLGYDWR